jgi:hypothetical protein
LGLVFPQVAVFIVSKERITNEKLKSFENLFPGGPLGRWHADEDEGKEKGGWWSEGFSLDFLDAFGVELPPSFDDGLFWFFVLFMVLFDIYTLWVLEVVKDTEAPPPTPCTPYDLTTNKDFEMLC